MIQSVHCGNLNTVHRFVLLPTVYLDATKARCAEVNVSYLQVTSQFRQELDWRAILQVRVQILQDAEKHDKTLS